MEQLNTLFITQRELGRRISRSFINFKKQGKAKMAATGCQTRLTQLEKEFSKFSSNHDTFVTLPGFDAHDYTTSDFYDQIQEIYFEMVDSFKAYLIACKSPSDLNETVISPNESMTAAMPRAINTLNNFLPKIHIPQFSGELVEWARFRDLFVSLVHNRSDLTPVIKFYHLSSLIEGDAQTKIRNLEVTSENYEVAWKILTDFYENKRRLINHSVGKLYSLKSMKTDTYAEVEKLFTGTFDTVGFLDSLGRSVETTGVDLIVWLTVSKFDPITRREWEKTLGDSTQASTLEELRKFFRDQMTTLEAIEESKCSRCAPNLKPATPKTHAVSTTVDNQTSAPKQKPCVCCGEAHKLFNCSKFKSFSPVNRLGLARSKSLCFLCLGSHSFKYCRSKYNCTLCGKKHNALLHEGMVISKLNSSSDANGNTSSPTLHPNLPGLNTSADTFKPVIPPQRTFNTVALDTFILLPTAWVKIENRGRSYFFRALIDQASQVSLITENCCQKLLLQRSRSSVAVEGVSSRFSEKTKGRVALKIRSLVNPDFSYNVDAWVLNKITNYQPLVSSELATLPHLPSAISVVTLVTRLSWEI